MVSEYGINLAKTVAEMIWKAAQKVPGSPLKEICLCGDGIRKFGLGGNADLVFVVDIITFRKYTEFCSAIPEAAAAITGNPPESRNALYDHQAPREERLVAASMAIGVDIDRLDLSVFKESLNVVVYLTGWDDPTCMAHRILNALLDDPCHLQGVIDSRVQLFPEKVLSRG